MNGSSNILFLYPSVPSCHPTLATTAIKDLGMEIWRKKKDCNIYVLLLFAEAFFPLSSVHSFVFISLKIYMLHVILRL